MQELRNRNNTISAKEQGSSESESNQKEVSEDASDDDDDVITNRIHSKLMLKLKTIIMIIFYLELI